jgi:hypothetical protein
VGHAQQSKRMQRILLEQVSPHSPSAILTNICSLSRDRDEWMLDMQSRLFWITSMFEAVLSQELNLPPSNSLHLEEHIALPKFISAQDIASFGSFRYPGDDPFFHYHFLSQLAHRLILTRARNSLFHFSKF